MGDKKDWTEEQVFSWLEKSGFGGCAALFKGHDIDGEVIPCLNDELLQEMGISSEEVRRNLLQQIRNHFGNSNRKSDPKIKRPLQAEQSKQRNLVEVYQEGSHVEENDSMYAHANRHGFLDDSEEAAPEEGTQDNTKKIIEREKKWQKMMSSKKKGPIALEYLQKQPEFKKRVYKGIPYSWRIQVWKLMAAGDVDESKMNIYQQMLDMPSSESDVNQIDLDINRTLRNHVNYKQRYGKGQMRLFNILRAYANYNPEVGFCQGMATVAAFLLIHCDEETTFWMLHTLVSHEKFSLQGLWISGFPTLMESFFVHDRLMKFHLPKLWKHFRNQKIHPSAYATRWYMTIFLSFPFHTCLRIWDIFLLEGFDMMFFLAIATLEYFSNELSSKDFEGIMEFLGQLPKQEIDDDKLIEVSVKVMRKTYSGMRGKAKALSLVRDEYKKILAEGGSPFADY